VSRALLVACGVLASATLWGCGDEVDVASQPVIGGERFVEVDFADVYRPATAVVKDSGTVDLVQTESLTLEGASPQSVVEAYGQALPADGWEVVQPPQRKRDGSWFGAWRRLGRNLVVNASEGTPTEEGANPPVDFVLSFQKPLGPDRITGVEPAELG
jgi:hypothetical protein